MPINYEKLKTDLDELSSRLHAVRGDIVESDVGNVVAGMMMENWVSIHDAVSALLICTPLDLASRLGAVIRHDEPLTKAERKKIVRDRIDGREVMNYIRDRSSL